MKIALFYHSLYSDWNHGNAHFLRGIAGVLQRRSHDVTVYEPHDAWSLQNLLADAGRRPIREFRRAYPHLRSRRYRLDQLDLDAALAGVDLVLVHEWNDPQLVARIGEHHRRHPEYLLFFHDTHHRTVSAPEEMARYDLRHFSGVLAYGRVIRDHYAASARVPRAFTWHEAADTDYFHPRPYRGRSGDLAWIGNWGDDERAQELREFLLDPVQQLGLEATVYGVRYPAEALAELQRANIRYAGWLPNHRVPQTLAGYRLALHVPRRPYATQLPGIPTIRVFETLACAAPLISAPWDDAEHLFTPGEDYLVATDGAEMTRQMERLLHDPDEATRIAQRGRSTVLARHTCAHRVDELFEICRSLRHGERPARVAAPRRRPRPLRIAFFGSSLVSAYWNGAATYYRGLIRALHERGHRITFYEPDAFERQAHRDMPDPDYARSVVYPATAEQVHAQLREAAGADVIVKASGVGVFDGLLEEAVLALRGPGKRVVFWDVDAPATLERVGADAADPFRALIPQYDAVFTYGGGDPVRQAYEALGARRCVPIYNGLDPDTHHPVPVDPRFDATLSFLGNRLPDREERVRDFFFGAARMLPAQRFLLGGNGWDDPADECTNVRYVGHVYTRDHNAFNSTPLTVLNISRASMARFGFSPATRVFEAAGAGACLVTDDWVGIDMFFEPGRECLVARDGAEVAEHVAALTPQRARTIGAAARKRALAEHSYARRAQQVEEALA